MALHSCHRRSELDLCAGPNGLHTEDGKGTSCRVDVLLRPLEPLPTTQWAVCEGRCLSPAEVKS